LGKKAQLSPSVATGGVGGAQGGRFVPPVLATRAGVRGPHEAKQAAAASFLAEAARAAVPAAVLSPRDLSVGRGVALGLTRGGGNPGRHCHLLLLLSIDLDPDGGPERFSPSRQQTNAQLLLNL
jgi:hypothetical protein